MNSAYCRMCSKLCSKFTTFKASVLHVPYSDRPPEIVCSLAGPCPRRLPSESDQQAYASPTRTDRRIISVFDIRQLAVGQRCSSLSRMAREIGRFQTYRCVADALIDCSQHRLRPERDRRRGHAVGDERLHVLADEPCEGGQGRRQPDHAVHL